MEAIIELLEQKICEFNRRKSKCLRSLKDTSKESAWFDLGNSYILDYEKSIKQYQKAIKILKKAERD
jgi:tetratricopeptide (TPR) repeat protein